MRSVVGVLVGSCLVAVGLIAGCSSSSSKTPPSPADVDSGDGEAGSVEAGDADLADAPLCTLPGVFGSDECHACLNRHCCAPIGACTSDPICKPLVLCILACLPKPDAGGCRAACEAANPGAEKLLDAVVLCGGRPADGSCGAVCATPQ